MICIESSRVKPDSSRVRSESTIIITVDSTRLNSIFRVEYELGFNSTQLDSSGALHIQKNNKITMFLVNINNLHFITVYCSQKVRKLILVFLLTLVYFYKKYLPSSFCFHYYSINSCCHCFYFLLILTVCCCYFYHPFLDTIDATLSSYCPL